ncbi:Non-specific lipid transfer protein GPI-anchored 5, partial [Linum perenne]
TSDSFYINQLIPATISYHLPSFKPKHILSKGKNSMAGRNMAMSLGIVLLTMQLLAGGARAQSDCTNVLISLSPCLNYITGNSSTPSQQCCGQFATVVRTSPLCLCQLLNGGGSSFGVNINRTRALELPRACNVQTPPVSRCNATAAPEGSPEPGIPSGPGKLMLL